MISKSAREQYIKELYRLIKSGNSRVNYLKHCTPRQLERLTEQHYREEFEFKTEPYKHQLVCFHLGIRFPCWMFMLDMGLGKTKIALDVAKHYVLAGEVNRMLAVVPTDVNVATWEDDAEIHCDLRVIGTYGSVPDKLDAIEDAPSNCVVIVTYPALMHMCSNKVRNKLVINMDAVYWIASKFDMLVFDEVHYLRNHSTLLWQVCNAIAERTPKVYGLTGTPLGDTALDLWAQFKVVTGEKAFPGTFEIFRASLFNAVEDTKGKFKWKLRRGMFRLVRSLIARQGIRYADNECMDIPDTIRQVRKVDWTEEGYGYYEAIGEASFFDPELPLSEKALAYHSMRGLSSGYMRWVDEEGQVYVFELSQNPKWEALCEIIEGLPKGRKLIVFYTYIYTGVMLERLITGIGETVVKVDGTTRKNHERLRTWQNDKEPRILIGNCQTIGTGANLQTTNYGVFFETTSAPIIRRQAEKRFSGARQVNFRAAHIVDLCMKGSLDKRLLEALEKGKDLFSEVIEGASESSGDTARVKVTKKSKNVVRVQPKTRPDYSLRKRARVIKKKRKAR